MDEAIRAAQFIRNSCLRYWMDHKGVTRNDLYKYCKVLADNTEFPWAKQLNSQARQAHAEQAWSAIARFFDHCKKQIPGKKGYPKFKKHQTRASVEYKLTGWKLSSDRKCISFIDGFKAGRFKLMGTRDLNFYQIEQINRVRIVRRSDGYSVQFVLDVERSEPCLRSNREIWMRQFVLISPKWDGIREVEGTDIEDAIAAFTSSVWRQGYNADTRVVGEYGDWRIYEMGSDPFAPLEYRRMFWEGKS